MNDLERKPIQGGSTIEQQYVKGVLVLQDLGNPRAEKAAIADNLTRKLDQLRQAVDVAHTMSKQDILAGYLNNAFYENGAWGIEAAAETYFGERAAKLTLAQAALLAGIVREPVGLRPHHATRRRRACAATPCSRGWRRRMCCPRRRTARPSDAPRPAPGRGAERLHAPPPWATTGSSATS